MPERTITWNWQQPGWPHFQWEAEALRDLQARFQHRAGLFQGVLRHLGADDKDALIIEVISAEAYKTSEIEGEILDRDSLQSSLRRNFGLDTDGRRTAPAEKGIADMMTALYRGFDKALDDRTLFDWHEMLMTARRDITVSYTHLTLPTIYSV